MIFDDLKPAHSLQEQMIKAYRSDAKGKKFIYLVAGIHGNEFEGIHLLQELYHWLSHNHEILDIPVIIIPILNPDGHRSLRKENSNGVDLDRNFSDNLLEPESAYLCKLLDRYPPEIFITFGAGKPSLVYHGDFAQKIAALISKINSYDMSEVNKAKLPGSLTEYLSVNYQCPHLTLQAGKISDDLSLADLWQQNKHALTQLFTGTVFTQSL